MQLATRILLLYLSFAFGDESRSNIFPEFYENVIEHPFTKKFLLSTKKLTDSYNGNVPGTPYDSSTHSNYKKITPITPLDDPVGNPHELKYQHRMKSNQSIVAGLDHLRPIDESSCLSKLLLTNTTMSSPAQCARTCRKGDRRICYYNFIAEDYPINGLACKLCVPGPTNNFCSDCQCVLADGIERSAQVINRQLPGPSIEVCEGDHVVIDVENRIHGISMSIHWHGLLQNGFQYYDGVPHLTQCPISTNRFRYQWGANNAGTHFWHAHSGLQKMDGIVGNLVVRQPPEQDIHSHLYDYDLSNHVLLITDWMHRQSVNYFPGRRLSEIGQLPHSLLINGKGQYTDPLTGNTTNTTLEVIDVEPGKRYRIRLVNGFCTICPGMFTIQDHKITIIATDGLDIKPRTVDSVTSSAGERYDFILHTNKSVGSYWIQLRGMGACSKNDIQQLAILRYKGAPSQPQSPKPTYYGGIPQGLVLNALNATCEKPVKNTICVSNLNSKEKEIDKRVFYKMADMKFYLPVGFKRYTLQEAFKPNYYSKFMVAGGASVITGLIDGISFTFPPSPPLSQPMDIPHNQYCNRTTIPERCKEDRYICTHRLKIPRNAVVEMLLVDELQEPNVSHPFHLHGHTFYVMGMGQATGEQVKSISWRIVQDMDNHNLIKRWFSKPVKKDTVVIPYNGYVVIRFLANNPGYWLFHCHFIYHQLVGMEILLEVGEREDIPPVPKDFPKCGQYFSSIGYNAYPPFVNNT